MSDSNWLEDYNRAYWKRFNEMLFPCAFNVEPESGPQPVQNELTQTPAGLWVYRGALTHPDCAVFKLACPTCGQPMPQENTVNALHTLGGVCASIPALD